MSTVTNLAEPKLRDILFLATEFAKLTKANWQTCRGLKIRSLHHSTSDRFCEFELLLFPFSTEDFQTFVSKLENDTTVSFTPNPQDYRINHDTIIDEDNPYHVATCMALVNIIAAKHSISPSTLEDKMETECALSLEMNGLETFNVFISNLETIAMQLS